MEDIYVQDCFYAKIFFQTKKFNFVYQYKICSGVLCDQYSMLIFYFVFNTAKLLRCAINTGNLSLLSIQKV